MPSSVARARPVLTPGRSARIRQVSLLSSFFSASAGSFSMLFSKVVMTALVTKGFTDGDWSVLSMWITWVAGVGLIVTAVTQLYLLNSALASGKAVFTIPVYTVLIITLAILQGGLLFDEFACLQPHQWAICSTAVVVLAIGVSVLSSVQESRAQKAAAAEKASATAKKGSETEPLEPSEPQLKQHCADGAGPGADSGAPAVAYHEVEVVAEAV